MGKVAKKKKTMLPRELLALEPETKFFDSASGADYSDVVMPEVPPDEALTALDKVLSAGDRTFVVAGSAKYKKVLLCWYSVALCASLTELKVRAGNWTIVFNKESTPYRFHRSTVSLQLLPHAEVSGGAVIPGEACSEAEEEDADGEDNDSADDPGSDDSEYTGKGTVKLKKSTKKATVEPEGADSGEDTPQSGSNSKTNSKKRGNPSIWAAEFARHLADAPVERQQPLLAEIETARKPLYWKFCTAWESGHRQVRSLQS